MKRFIFLVSALLILTGCAGKINTTMSDERIADNQRKMVESCNKRMQENTPDMSQWKPDQIMAYEAIQGLKDANKIIAGKSTDPCAEIAGKSVYEAQIDMEKENTKRQKNWMSFGKNIAGKALWGTVAYFGAEAIKDIDDDNTTIQVNDTGYSDGFTDGITGDDIISDDIVVDPISE